jgi:hypothetical protein
VLASAKPASQHAAYDDEDSTRSDDRETDTVEKTGESTSGLFDLDLSDVAGVDRGERGINPLGHHGDSENYYVVDERAETAYDHKYKASYTALTHLLVEEGTRDADSPEGSLNDEELFDAWVFAKEQNHLGDDDPVPYGALRGVAVPQNPNQTSHTLIY